MQSKVSFGAKIILGLIYFVFGLNGFLNFIPPPPDMPEAAMNFFKGVSTASYFIPFLKGTEVTAGMLLLSGFASPVALIVLAPITIQIFLFHSFLTPGLQNLILPTVMVIAHVLAAKNYWHLYKPMFAKV